MSAPDIRRIAAAIPSLPADLARLNEAALINLARVGSEAAVRILVQRHNRLLFRLARGYVHDDAEAEDIVQETYVRAFVGLAQFRGESAFSTWLARIAIHEAQARCRKRRRRVKVALDTLDHSRGAEVASNIVIFPAPDAEAVRGEVRAALERAVDRLPTAYRVVFVLRDIEGLSVQDTATALGIRPATVKTRLFRGRALMRRALEQEFHTGFAELFPFAGRRCLGIAERVVGRLHLRNQADTVG